MKIGENSDSAARLRVRRGLVGLGLLIAAFLLLAVSVGSEPFTLGSIGPGQDARAYWDAANGEPYAAADIGRFGAYLYSPAFLQLIAPLTALPWAWFLAIWTALLLATTFVLVGPLLLAPILLLAFFELWGGNVHLLLALAIVAGFRWPSAWAFVLLTKVTPGIGLLWFAARREWRSLAIALAATALVMVASYLIAPALWAEWIAILQRQVGSPQPPGALHVPLVLRLPLAALLTVFAARTDRRWLLPAAAWLALPALWWGSLAMLAGVVALRRNLLERELLRLLTPLTAQRRRRVELRREPMPEA